MPVAKKTSKSNFYHDHISTVSFYHNHTSTFLRIKYYSISVSMHILQSGLHVVQVGIGYFLMLVAMTYNGWLFLAIIFGAGVGYLIFAKSRHLMGNFREMNEHCR